MKIKIQKIQKEYNELKEKLADQQIISQLKLYKQLSARFKELWEIIECYNELEHTQITFEENKKVMKDETEPELVQLFEEENLKLEKKAEALLTHLKSLLIPKDPNDKKNAIMEIRAGTGGDEASLFTADLFRMYSHFIEKKGWKIDVMNSNSTLMGGFKEISFEVIGKNTYGTLKYESGVHRVQRVPETESSGRIHTSAASVVVLPEAEEIDFKINENDLKIDVFHSSGPGGQSVNTTDSAVRITHIPTSIVVTCQDEKSQLKNKVKAMKVLRSRLLDIEIQKQQQSIANQRKLMVGTGDRSAKIRTYNFPQSRITDHRINYTTHNLESVMNGNLDALIESLHIEIQKEMVAEND
ncbi:MAG: peptide chain release factor 1 [Candidatus Cloacimonetes bacterium]|nr:peptide chain release factor 1 [Candidatus Cloacimonadota bacterium]MBL7086879.1 peptide chain release factor 1 [Candidatus Cloacimonadota bacterium]